MLQCPKRPTKGLLRDRQSDSGRLVYAMRGLGGESGIQPDLFVNSIQDDCTKGVHINL